MAFNPLIDYTTKIHRKRDKELSEKWKQDHENGICGGVDEGCYVCAKNELFNSVRDILSEQESTPH